MECGDPSPLSPVAERLSFLLSIFPVPQSGSAADDAGEHGRPVRDLARDAKPIRLAPVELGAHGQVASAVQRRMGLSGGLSNHDLRDRLDRIICHLQLDEKRQPREAFRGYSDGRREFGTVSAAIWRVMEEAGGELRVLDVRRGVEGLLGGPVSRFTVGDHLLEHSGGVDALYERTRRGCYRARSAAS